MYVKPRPKSTRSINTKDCVEIVANPEYIKKVFSIIYKLNTNDMTKSKNED